jgi:hypothetical protein
MALMDFAKEGDTVMVCKHIFEAARAGNPPVLSDLPRRGRFSPRREFVREDGTCGKYDFAIICRPCLGMPPDSIDMIEETVRGGMLHVADFIRQ